MKQVRRLGGKEQSALTEFGKWDYSNWLWDETVPENGNYQGTTVH